MSAKTIAALPFVLCSVLADACDTFTISGRVADQGSGLDTWIGVFQDPLADQAEPVESTWVDAGEFELEVPCAESVTLLAVRKGAVPLARRIPGSAPTAVDLRFAPGLSLTGSVHSDENLPIGGARVSVTRTDEAEVRLPESLTTWRSSKDGAFVAEGLAPGTYRVAASADGHMPVELPEVVVGEGGANRVDMRLPRAFFIAGRVVDTSGLAVAGAEIHGEPSMSRGTTAGTTATSDSEGGFRLGPFKKVPGGLDFRAGEPVAFAAVRVLRGPDGRPGSDAPPRGGDSRLGVERLHGRVAERFRAEGVWPWGRSVSRIPGCRGRVLGGGLLAHPLHRDQRAWIRFVVHACRLRFRGRRTRFRRCRARAGTGRDRPGSRRGLGASHSRSVGATVVSTRAWVTIRHVRLPEQTAACRDDRRRRAFQAVRTPERRRASPSTAEGVLARCSC